MRRRNLDGFGGVSFSMSNVAAGSPPPISPYTTIITKLHDAANSFFALLPNIIGGILFLVVAYFVAGLIQKGFRTLLHKRHRADLGGVLGPMIFGAIMVLAVLFAAAIVFPTIHPGSIISALGIGSVAVGFAFKDILQNLLAGILLLVTRPYRTGDQIVVKDFEGTVERIESRATLIKTYDGRRVIIPNSDLYTSPVVVNTAFPNRRDDFEVGIGYADHPREAGKAFIDAIKGIDGVEQNPEPEALPWELADSYVTLKLRWWVSSARTDIIHTRARVILAVWETAAAHGIDLPYPTQIMLFHDQTEETDGDRTKQREGWPAGKNPPGPRRLGATKNTDNANNAVESQTARTE